MESPPPTVKQMPEATAADTIAGHGVTCRDRTSSTATTSSTTASTTTTTEPTLDIRLLPQGGCLRSTRSGACRAMRRIRHVQRSGPGGHNRPREHRARHQGLDLGHRGAVRAVRLRPGRVARARPRRPDPREHPRLVRRAGRRRLRRTPRSARVVPTGVRLPRPRRARAVRRAGAADARRGRPDLRELGPGRHRRRAGLRPPGPGRGRRSSWSSGPPRSRRSTRRSRTSSGSAPVAAATARCSPSRRSASTTCTTWSTTCGTSRRAPSRPPSPRETCEAHRVLGADGARARSGVRPLVGRAARAARARRAHRPRGARGGGAARRSSGARCGPSSGCPPGER